ncbi:MAG: NAD(P)H-dependent glycerol-3-phosphate dehydrogenase, partial [Bacteroidia bacterium]|nr:NAD(P)H-dependent glycerol-3-phosphate dehydrogenase [Bacteroidia bacterium]
MSEGRTIGVIGSGSFGVTIASLLSHNEDVLLYARNRDTVISINDHNTCRGYKLNSRIKATASIEEVSGRCQLLFPMVPSKSFRNMIRDFAPYLRPYHTIIHATKGFDLQGLTDEQLLTAEIDREDVFTMSQVIAQESAVLKIGCLAGPNLAAEILSGQPTATVIGSEFDEVIKLGKAVLKSSKFFVFGTHDILGAELSGILKNPLAIGAGLLEGSGYGKNVQAMMLTRGLTEMIQFGKAVGASSYSFLGTAGIGDLIATANSKTSRNFTFGYRIGQGEKVEDVMKTMPELAEGVRTLRVMNRLSKRLNIDIPINEM